MKKTLSLILAALMLTGTLAVSAGATSISELSGFIQNAANSGEAASESASETEADKTGSTSITATVENALEYEIVIPEAVTMTTYGVKEIGAAKVENVKNAKDSTVIFYTAEGDANFVMTGDTSKTMAAAYYTDSTGSTALVSTAENVVYENNADADPLTTLYVKVEQTVWESAENGTYTAQMNYAFDDKEEETETASGISTVGDILNTVAGGFPTSFVEGWKKADDDRLAVYLAENKLVLASDNEGAIGVEAAVSEGLTVVDENTYSYTTAPDEYDRTFQFTFYLTDSVLTCIVVTSPIGVDAFFLPTT